MASTSRKWREEHPSYCEDCGKERPASKAAKCRECWAISRRKETCLRGHPGRELYKACRDCSKENSKNRADVNRAKAFELLGGKCKDCGLEDTRVLQFDHLRDKVCNVAGLLSNVWTSKKLQDELSKCELVCANCHVLRTIERRLSS